MATDPARPNSSNGSGETSSRYYVGFYDMFDGWGAFGWNPDLLYDDLEEAKVKALELQDVLPEGNKDCGEHYGVLDSNVGREVYCTMEKA